MLLSGKKIADELESHLKKQVAALPTQPALAVVLVGSHAPSLTYVKRKQQACERVGIRSHLFQLSAQISQKELHDHLQALNQDPKIHGILLQLPLSPHLQSRSCFELISPKKDVDGLHPENMGKLLLGVPGGIVPCTPLGVQTLLQKAGFSFEGKHVVIVGRSDIVGKPLAALLIQNSPKANATVTLAHSKTPHLKKLTQQADILVAAVGSPRLIKADMVKEGAIVVDVGMNREDDLTLPRGYRLVGDVDYESVASKAQAITPVPGGVGPLTVSMLLHNTLQCYHLSVS